MSDATPVKRGLTLAWSIGLGLLLLGLTTVLLLPATKNARIRFDQIEQATTEDELVNAEGDPVVDGDGTEGELTPSQSP